jgi:uncharacterized membrane protein
MARGLNLALIAIGVAYPFLVYFGLRILPPGYVAAGLGALVAVRVVFGNNWRHRDALPYLIAGVIVLLIATHSPLIGLKAYPVLLSLTFAAVFAYSLWAPPTIIERIARVSHPDLPLEANSYLRKVTIAWVIFLLVNAGISAATAASGNLRVWTLYNGLISYLAMGTMFAGEFLIRQRVHQQLRQRHAWP